MTLSQLLPAVLNTLLVILLSSAIAVPLGTAVAVLLFRTNVIGRRLAGLAVASQLAVPLYVFAGGWSAGMGLQGWCRVADWLGPTGVAWMQGWFGKLFAVGLIHALASFPWCCFIVGMGLASSVRAEEDTAILEGGFATLLRYAWLPRLRVWIAAACLWCCLGPLTDMAVSNLYMLSTVTELVYLDFSRQMSSPLTYLAATGFCMVPLVSLGYFIGGRLPKLHLVLSKPRHFPASEVSLGKWRPAISMLLWFSLLALIGLPLLNLIVKAGWAPQPHSDGSVGYGWDADRFLLTCVESVTLFRNEYYWSISLALSSTLVASLMAIFLFWLTGNSSDNRRYRARLVVPRGAVHLVMAVVIATPGPLVGEWVTTLLNQQWPDWMGDPYVSTLAAPILAQQFRLLPVCWLMVVAILAGLPSRTWELARQDGLTNAQILRIVVWPQTWPQWMAMLIMLPVLSVGELNCSIGVLPPGVTTAAMRLFEILHFGMRHQDSALCGILVLFGWMAAFLMAWAVKGRF